MTDTQSLVANLVAQMKSIQSQLDRMNGNIEEIEHRQGQMTPENLSKLSENVNLLKTQQESDTTQLLQIQNELKDQRTFLEKVTASLTAVKANESSPKTAKKKNARETLNEALELVKKDRFAEARNQLETLVDYEGLTAGDKNKVLHGLGRVEYFTGNHEKAMVYFSKIFTKYPKATLAPSSLLFIGRSLEKMGKKEEAKQAFQKVVEDYSRTKEANEARKEL
jgi:TolA-binding protein